MIAMSVGAALVLILANMLLLVACWRLAKFIYKRKK